jgi:hypothetical protein
LLFSLSLRASIAVWQIDLRASIATRTGRAYVVRKEITLELNCGAPEFTESSSVTVLKLKESTLRHNYFGISRRHVLELTEIGFIRALSAWKKVGPISFLFQPVDQILLKQRLSGLNELKPDSPNLFSLTFNLCLRCLNVALVAIEDRNLDAGGGK